jgi:DNA-binding transcriptional LysR family regulator
MTSARRADERRASYLQFAHSDLTVYTSVVADLLAAFRSAHPEVEVRVSTLDEAEQRAALREHRVDVAATFLATWPIRGFGVRRLADSSLTGVLLPTSHPLAAKPAVRLGELRNLTFLHMATGRWPKLYRAIQSALRERGLVPSRHRERPPEAPSGNVEIAAGDAWALANEAIAAQYRATTAAITYRPFLEPPIPIWLALIWLPEAPELALRLLEVSGRLYPTAPDQDSAQQIA